MNIQFYTPTEAAAILKCDVRTLRRHAHRIGKKKGPMRLVRFSEQEIRRIAGVK